jgi:hypothetical protein
MKKEKKKVLVEVKDKELVDTKDLLRTPLEKDSAEDTSRHSKYYYDYTRNLSYEEAKEFEKNN